MMFAKYDGEDDNDRAHDNNNDKYVIFTTTGSLEQPL